jgi:hypothetical protein
VNRDAPLADTKTLVFTSFSRPTIWQSTSEDDFHEEIQCAIREDGSSPAFAFLASLCNGADVDDPKHDPPEDRDQIYDYAKLVAIIEHIGCYGHPRKTKDVKHLSDGVWELRHGVRRLSYWDISEDGVFNPKLPNSTADTSLKHGPDDRYPDMDWFLRLGCGWHKDGDLAPPAKIEEAKLIRAEDAAHDRT